MIVFRVEGPHAHALFANESGGHRWQRVPPIERNGSIHTSIITGAALPEPSSCRVQIRDCDLEWSTCRASGALIRNTAALGWIHILIAYGKGCYRQE
jgi:peptide chain release factor 1